MKKSIKIIITLLVLTLLAISAFLVTKNYFPKIHTQYIAPLTDVTSIFNQEPTETPETKVVFNSDPNSNLAMIATTANNEAIAVFTKTINGLDYINEIVIQTPDKKTGIAQVNQAGLPTSFTFEGDVFNFSNYTETTVDISIKKANGTTQQHKAIPLNLPTEKISFTDKLIPPVYAISSDTLPPKKGTPRNSGSSVKYFFRVTGQVVNVLTCTGGIIATAMTGGGASPTLITCTFLFTRAVTSQTEFGPCKGDLIACATENFLDFAWDTVIEGEGLDQTVVTVNEVLETFFPSGITIKGNIYNNITKSPLKPVLRLLDKKQTNKAYNTDEVDDKGNYSFTIKDGGAYIFKVVSIGYQDIIYEINISDSIINITEQYTLTTTRRTIGKNEDKDEIIIELNMPMIPAGYIHGEVINSLSGEPYSDVIVGLLEGGETTETLDDGTFLFQPPLNDRPQMVAVQAKGEQCSSAFTSVFLSYEMIDPISDQYKLYKDSSLRPLYEYDPSDSNVIIKMPPIGLSMTAQVIDVYTNKGIANVEIDISQLFSTLEAQTTTDSNGYFSINLSQPLEIAEGKDSFNLTLKKDGYINHDLNYYIFPAPKQNDKYVISTKLDGTDRFNCQIELNPFYGRWEGRAESSVSAIGDDIVCSGAKVSFSIDRNYELRGTARADLNYILTLDGTVNKKGHLKGGMATGGENVASFILDFDPPNGIATGTWSDQFGCKGTINLEKDF